MEPHNLDQLTELFTPALWMILNALVLSFCVLATGLVLVCFTVLAWHCCLGLRDGVQARMRRAQCAASRGSKRPLSVQVKAHPARFTLASRIR